MNILQRAVKFLPVTICAAALIWGTAAGTQSTGRQWYVAPNGSDANSGAITSPLSLGKALSSSSPARAGDTIWVRGGTYRSAYSSYLAGTASAPITVRAYPGERVILDANNTAARQSDVVLSVFGAHTRFWGLEITSSDPTRLDTEGPHGPNGVYVNTSQNVKFINMIVHDLPGQAFGLWAENTDAEVYGSLVYYNGSNHWDHGIYVQNRTGTKRIVDNLVFQQASHGIHAYGSSDAYLDNIVLEGNTVYESGMLAGSGERNILLGGLRKALNPVVISNYTYFRGTNGNSNIGYSAGAANAQVKNNYWIAGNAAVRLIGLDGASQVTGNFFSGPLDPSDAAARWPSNTYTASRPTTGATVFVRPNRYEPGRAHITVYNWSGAGSVQVNLSSAGLAAGDQFEIRDAMNYFGVPAVTGTYTGAAVTLPMTGLQPSVPRGNGLNMPVHTAPKFGAFVLVKTDDGGGPGGGDTVPPTVSVTAPSAGQTVSGTVTLAANAGDDTGVAGVQFQVDGANVGAEDAAAPYSVAWNSAAVTSGVHTVRAIARDAAGNTSLSSNVSVSTGGGTGTPVRISLEAEAATLGSPMVRRSDGLASGGQYVVTSTANGGYARFTVNIPVSGTYVVWAGVLVVNDTSDSFFVRADNGTRDIFDIALGKWSTKWQWAVVNGRGTGAPASISPRKFTLSAGTHTFTFDGREANARLDKIIVTNDLAFVPQ